MVELAYLLDRHPHGQTHIVNELKSLAAAGKKVHIIAVRRTKEKDIVRVQHTSEFPVTYLDDKGGVAQGVLRDSLVCLRKYPLRYSEAAMTSLRWFGENFKLTGSLIRALERVNPQLVFVNWSWALCGSTMYACRVLGLPFVFSVQGTDITPPSRNFGLRVKSTERIITPSPAYAKILSGELAVPKEKIRIVPNCLEGNSFENIAPARDVISGPVRLVYLGTLRPVKRHEDLINACGLLAKKGIEVECRIFGEGPDRPKLEKLISDLGLNGKVLLKGHVPHEELPSQLEWCDMYVHTSEREAFAHAILEAQASGRPLILADGVGGIRDSVIPGETAIMVPVGAPEEIAASVERLMNDTKKRKQMGEAGRRFVMNNFSHVHFAPRFLKALFE